MSTQQTATSAAVAITTDRFAKGAYITIEGEKNSGCFFIIREGKVRISKALQIIEEEGGSNILGPGDFFGVVSTMSNRCHIETARALTDVLLISVPKEQFGWLIPKNTAVAMKIILQFSRRMRHLNETLTGITLKKGSNVDAEHLFTVAQHYAKQNQYAHACYTFSKYVKYCPTAENVAVANDYLERFSSHAKACEVNYRTDGMNRTYPKDAIIFSEGEPGDEIFIIKSGAVKISKVTENGDVLLAILKTGAIFGEMAMLDASPRGASVTAYEDDCQVMVLNKANFNQMIKTQPQLIARLTTLLAERIWMSYKQLYNAKIIDPVGRLYDMLLINLEKCQVDITAPLTHIFDFGIDELIGMVGFTRDEAATHTNKLQQNKLIEIVDDKICVQNVQMFAGQAAYYRKMTEKADKLRREKEKEYVNDIEKNLKLLDDI